MFASYTTPREAYSQAIIPAFRKLWRVRTGEDLSVRESYLASGAQARAIVGGFEADVAALSIAPDIDVLNGAGLLVRNWKSEPHGGIVSRSIVVIAVRPGNPKGIHDWDDLRRPNIDVLTPDVRTSGSAMWNITSIYGACIRGRTTSRLRDSASAPFFLRDVLRNVKRMDSDARESMNRFEAGEGDAAIVCENEVLLSKRRATPIEYVVPHSTILIENPATVVDANAKKHHTIDLAEAFLAFLRTPEVQHVFVDYGFRAVDESVTAKAAALPAVTDLFTIKDLGGWSATCSTSTGSTIARTQAHGNPGSSFRSGPDEPENFAVAPLSP
ncbi:MAG: sulfate ABC transporter substrate-binding protein [Planctomycetes bacterium]|nr:sulfate ABC transporter substrate-binding protein [Planctomycetota bacterium]MBI3843217.1 sulfate ABC transporter substrate-binding protein [Planctomycetota bacterium]